jgi:valyl-tRNA synthetase
MKELSKGYEPNKYEDGIYKRWEDSGFFNPDNLEGKPYTIMMPPPNVTGILHLGHSLENTIMDAMIRYQRMQGKKTLLLPGTDHAAVATQAKVESMLVAEGIEKPREELGREKLLERIKEFSEASKTTILKQVRKMGTSADWSRLAYTFDDKRSTAVNELFLKMYNDGLIYRGHRVINWSVKGQCTCSEDELVYIDRKAKIYTFKYSEDFPFTIATTRPETKVGDTAVAVHPEDSRYREHIGKTFDVTFCGVELKIKVIGDEHVDPEFGTGALGVTPAHSQTDFEMYEKHNAAGDTIDIIQVIAEDGTMTEAAGDFAGLPVLEAREKIVECLKKDGLFVEEVEIDQNVGTSDRFKDVVEAIPKTQWFVAVNREIMDKGKTLRQLVAEAVDGGHNDDPNKKVNLIPESQLRRHEQRIAELHDWCISRQIWWGHRIPVWYKGDAIFCGLEAPKEDGWVQDEDTLDTWFSSGLWTFSTLGWPDESGDLKTFHPTNFMQFGHEILFLWFQRMIMLSTYLLDDIPFKNAYAHGLVRNKEGKKFSKSDGNVADPIDTIEKYGTDALRYSLVASVSPGNDLRFYDEKIESAKNFVNKLWNISRFILMNIEAPKHDAAHPKAKTHADEWILSQLDALVIDVTDNLETFNFAIAAEKLKEFTKNDLADWYLEIAKVEGEKNEILNYVLNTVLKLWHPFMPFVTEVIWSETYGEDQMLMVEKWPAKQHVDVVTGFETLQNLVVGIRSLRNEYNIPAGNKVDVVVAGDKEGLLKDHGSIIQALARVESIKDGKKEDGMVGFVEKGIEVYIDLKGSVDIEKESARIEKELASVEPYAASLEKKLSNAEFTDNAPEAVVHIEQTKLEEAKVKIEKLKEQLSSLKK